MNQPLGLTKEGWYSTPEYRQWDGTVMGIEVIVTYHAERDEYKLIVFADDDDDDARVLSTGKEEPTLKDVLTLVRDIIDGIDYTYNYWLERETVIQRKIEEK